MILSFEEYCNNEWTTDFDIVNESMSISIDVEKETEKIVDFINMLYSLRSASNSVSNVAKFMIAQIYGKSCVSGSKSITSIVDDSDLELDDAVFDY